MKVRKSRTKKFVNVMTLVYFVGDKEAKYNSLSLANPSSLVKWEFVVGQRQ
jgi:hypothetical protein